MEGFRSQDNEREHVNEWIYYGLKVAVQSALHPLEYAKVLIQVSKLRRKS